MKKIIAILIFTVLTLNLSAKTVVISDLDETLRVAHSHNKVHALSLIMNGLVKPFPSMQYIFNDYKADRAQFTYVSASYFLLYSGIGWISKFKFPLGQTIQKISITEKSLPYKIRVIKRLYRKQ